MRNLLERLQLLEKDDYAELEDLPLKKQALVTLLIDCQKKMNDLKDRIEEYKTRRGKIEPEILAAIKKVEATGVKCGKVLVYIQQGQGFASFKEVFAIVQDDVSPKVAKLLADTYEQLSKDKKRGEELRVKMGRESSMEEDWAGIWAGLKGFFHKVFDPLIDSISGSLDKVESLLGMK